MSVIKLCVDKYGSGAVARARRRPVHLIGIIQAASVGRSTATFWEGTLTAKTLGRTNVAEFVKGRGIKS